MTRREWEEQDADARAAENAKHRHGLAKPPMHYVPPSALLHLGKAMESGGLKYGPFNWGDGGVVSSIYYDAAMRHLMAWWSGEDIDPDSGVHHLAHVMACCAIVLDSRGLGNLSDDRGTTAPLPIRGDMRVEDARTAEQMTDDLRVLSQNDMGA